MIERHTGHVVHIDFGDCFEVAMSRERAPERVPFRLTRMCVNAMEVSGIEGKRCFFLHSHFKGNFRTTCELVMSCLRDNKDSLMAVLEAFVHDPLITWRLVEVGGAGAGAGADGGTIGTSSTMGVEVSGAAVTTASVSSIGKNTVSRTKGLPGIGTSLAGMPGHSLQTKKLTAG